MSMRTLPPRVLTQVIQNDSHLHIHSADVFYGTKRAYMKKTILRRSGISSTARIGATARTELTFEAAGQKVTDPEELRRHTLTRWLYNEQARRCSGDVHRTRSWG